jgi:trk system potassium uptake protein TrkH
MTEIAHKHALKQNKSWLTSSRIVLLSFVAVIFVGTCLLLLPFASKASGSLSFIDALFTATSATCVTGLAIGNTYATFTVFGQIIILLLIQFGGLGFMTI